MAPSDRRASTMTARSRPSGAVLMRRRRGWERSRRVGLVVALLAVAFCCSGGRSVLLGGAARSGTPGRHDLGHAGVESVPGPLRVPPSRAATVVSIDGGRLGPPFEGIGAISGGGGNSRFLVDYPPTERSAILDYLFRPGFGASLQLLKLEIGGGANTTDGSEPSVEPLRGQVDCRAGYELWLARQALARDPALRVGALQWSAPGWVRGRHGTLWTERDIRYLLTWLGCARRAGVRISFLGGWNEHYTPGDASIGRWYVALRRALDRAGYADVRIVAADANGARRWAVVRDLMANPAFGRAVAIIGAHDICGHRSSGYRCRVTAAARRYARAHHKWLWQSELGRLPDLPVGPGPGALARSLDNAYLQGAVTATLLWPLLGSDAPAQPFPHRGLVAAEQPWSGHYWVSPLAWVVAQTTQFTEPGWRFAVGGGGHLRGGETYVTYAAPDRSAWSTVIETSTRRSWLRVWIHVTGGLPTAARAWATRLDGSQHLVDLGAVPERNGWLRVEVPPQAVTTITTARRPGPVRAWPSDPPARPMPLPYQARPDLAGMPAMLAPLQGSFQYSDGWLAQTTLRRPVEWTVPAVGLPYAVVGRSRWDDYTVTATVRLPSDASARRRGGFLLAGYRGARGRRFRGYTLSIDRAGRWQLMAGLRHVLECGRVRAARTYTLSLTVQGRHIRARIDGRSLAAVRVAGTVVGLAGLGALGYEGVRFRRFEVSAAGSGRSPTGPHRRGRHPVAPARVRRHRAVAPQRRAASREPTLPGGHRSCRRSRSAEVGHAAGGGGRRGHRGALGQRRRLPWPACEPPARAFGTVP